MKLLSVFTAAPVLMAWEGHYLQPGPGKAVQDCKVLYVSLRPQLHMMHTNIVSQSHYTYVIGFEKRAHLEQNVNF